jgi:hypothetical protein
MKRILVYYIVLAVSCSLFAQSSREEKLEQLSKRTDIKATEVENDILKLEYPGGNVMYKNVGDYKPDINREFIYSPTFDSTIIDLTIIDTTLYNHKYSFWQEVPVGGNLPTIYYPTE